MKIAVVTHYFTELPGGLQTVAEEIAEGLAVRHGAEVRWHASGRGRTLRAQTAILRVGSRSSGIVDRVLRLPYPIWSPAAFASLWRSCRWADAVHVHDYIYPGSVAAVLFAKWLKKPVVLTQHIGFIPYRSRLYRGLLRSFNATLGRAVLAAADQTVFCSRRVQASFGRVRFRRPPALVASGVDAELYRPASPERRLEIRAGLGIPADRPVFLFVGRFVEKKGIEILRELCRRFHAVEWALAGWGPLDPGSWGLPNVRVYRGRTWEQLVPLYQAADLLVLPSKGEGFPLVIQESMACGTPALAGMDAALADPSIAGDLLWEDAENVDAVESWARRIGGILEGTEALPDRGRVSEFAGRQWPWAKCVDAYHRIFEEVLRARPMV